MGLSGYRAGQVRLHLRKADPADSDKPLPPRAPGLPRWSDFWVMLTLALALFLIILFASPLAQH